MTKLGYNPLTNKTKRAGEALKVIGPSHEPVTTLVRPRTVSVRLSDSQPRMRPPWRS